MGAIMQIDGFWGYLYWANLLLAVCVVVYVILNNRNPIRTLAWIMVLLFLPFLGLVLYFFFGRDTRKMRYINRRSLSKIMQRTHLYYRSQAKVDVPYSCAHLATYLENVALACPMPGTAVSVITDVPLFASRLLAAIEGAKEHVHLQFYIFENDEFGRRVRDALVRKAREGVEVRVIYDSVGCWPVPRTFFDEIAKAGGHVEAFLKVRFPVLGDKVNYRNHRKVVVVDGKRGFIGGCNIADRYINGLSWGRWRDTMLALEGAAVHGLQASFLIDWYFANGTLVCGEKYFPTLASCGKAVVQVAQSNPLGSNLVIMSAVIKILAQAREYVYIQTPYLMPSDAVGLAMRNAALSGVDVRLMIPRKGDNRVLDYAAYSYLGELMEAGVKVLLYDGGFLHAKTIVSDGVVSSVGSANIDSRSFYYNFEVSAFVYDSTVATGLKRAFHADEKHCHHYKLHEHRSRSFARRCAESAARLFSPLF